MTQQKLPFRKSLNPIPIAFLEPDPLSVEERRRIEKELVDAHGGSHSLMILYGAIKIKPVGKSLNPTLLQIQEIKCEHLKRRFERTGVTPAMIFHGQKLGVIDWIEREETYLTKGRYANFKTPKIKTI